VLKASFGTGASYAVMRLLRSSSREMLEKGTYRLLTGDVITFDELNHPA
jgi:hypothetical protein